MSTPTGIDHAAPVIAQHEIEIRAPLEIVWRLHTDVNDWTTWQTDITASHADGPFEPGASFEWTSFGFSVRSTIYRGCRPVPRAVGWHGRRHHRGARVDFPRVIRRCPCDDDRILCR